MNETFNGDHGVTYRATSRREQCVRILLISTRARDSHPSVPLWAEIWRYPLHPLHVSLCPQVSLKTPHAPKAAPKTQPLQIMAH